MRGHLPRVLWVETVGWRGGACRSMVEVVSRLHLSGRAEVAVALPDGPVRERLAALGVETLPLSRVRPRHPDFSHPFVTLRWPVDLEWAQSEIGELANSWKADIIHANTWAAAMAVPKGIPAIWHVRDYPRHPLPLNLAAKHVRRVIAISPAVERQLLALLSPGLREKVVRIDNGIDLAHCAAPLSKEEARRALGLPPDRPVIGMAAYYTPWKRHDLFLETAGLFARPDAPPPGPDAIWAVAGDDCHGEQVVYTLGLKKKAAALGDRVRLLGHVDPSLFLPAIDRLVHPARDEPFGRIVCEAMAFGVPVIAHRSGGPADILGQGAYGRLVGEATPEAFAQAIGESFLEPQAEREERVAKARAFVRDAYDVGRVAERLEDAYVDWTARSPEP